MLRLVVFALVAAGLSAQQRPNILLIVADDMGYSDLGAYGSEIETPNLDRLARSGMMLTNFHASSSCGPTRAMLLTGVDHHRGGLGTQRGMVAPPQQGQPGYELFLNKRVVTVATLLSEAGYHTSMVGKWHLGGAPDQVPSARGFEQTYALMQGNGGHFDMSAGLPTVPRPSIYKENGKNVQVPADFYSTTTFTDKIISHIDKHHGDGRPFFAYAAYTAPHWPLHAPDEAIAKYEGVYDEGYEAIRAKRLAKMRELGLIAEDHPAAPPFDVWKDWNWDALSGDQQKLEARRMEIYAAMVDVLDQNVGRLLKHLEEIGELDNTFIFFQSDNGPEGGNPTDIIPNSLDRLAEAYDNSFDNLGRKGSYLWTGPGWAHVSSTPWAAYKAFSSQGGLLVPAFAVHPGKIEAGSRSDAFATVLDVTPTLLELGGVEHPAGEREVYPVIGDSMLGLLHGDRRQVHDSEAAVGWEVYNRRGLRKGEWKITWINEPWGKGDTRWALFNLDDDPAEQKDLAEDEPEKFKEMLDEWDRYVRDNGLILVDTVGFRYANTDDYYTDERYWSN